MGEGETKIMLWIILASGLILRLISLDQSLWLDEAINVIAAKNYSLLNLITEYAEADFHPPGFFIILWFWGKLFGYSEIAVRIPSVIFGLGTILITYLIGKKLDSKKLGILAALLIAINPLHIYYSQEARMYSMAALAVAINILLLIKLIKGERVNFIFLVFSQLLILMSDYVAYLIYPAELLVIFFRGKIARLAVAFGEPRFQRERAERAAFPAKGGVLAMTWLGSLFVAVILSIWWLPVFFKQLDVGAGAVVNMPAWKLVAGGFDLKEIPLTFIKFVIGRISLADKTIYYPLLLTLGSLFAYLIFRAIKYGNSFSRNLLVIWVSAPLVTASLVSLIVPVFSYFRVFYVLPAFILLFAMGILTYKGKSKLVFLSTVIIIQIFCAFVYLLIPQYQREDWKGLVEFFKGGQQVILFESSGTFSPFDYYAKGDLKAYGALKNFPARDEGDLIDLKEKLRGSKEIYLVEYLVELSDPNRLVEKQLVNLNYKKTDIKNFTGVGLIYKYSND